MSSSASARPGGVRYFDHNATSPLCEAARRAWLETIERHPGNPSSPHRIGARAERVLETARESLATALRAPPGDIVWTSGATEANNTVLYHFAQSGVGTAWISAIEHPCVHAAAARWLPGRHRLMPVTASGVVDLDWIADQLRRERPGLIALMAANNETGVLQPWDEVLALCREFDVPLFCDAAQWMGKLPAAGLGACTFLAGCAHKFGGPPGVGFLKCPAGSRALLVGGPQEDGRRAGTENVPGAVACGAALLDRERRVSEEQIREWTAARDAFEERIARSIPGVQILGRDVPRLWNTSALLMPPVDCRRRWVVRLDTLGFAVSTGSACASGREKPSYVLKAMGLDGGGDRMIRASAGWEDGVEAWESLASAVEQVAAEFGAVPR